MKKIILSTLCSFLSIYIWACSCFPPPLDFLGLWTYYVSEGWTLPIAAECVAIETECEGTVYVVNNILYSAFPTNLLPGDTIKIWNGDGASCYETPYTQIGDTTIIGLSDFEPGYQLSFEYFCDYPDVNAYKNYVVSYCGPTFQNVMNGMVGTGIDAIPLSEYGTVLTQAAELVVTEVDFRLMLEGAYQDGQMDALLSPYLPLTQPYDVAPYYHSQDIFIYNPLFLDDAVDWVLIEARAGEPSMSGDRSTVTVETQIGLLYSTGYLAASDGSSQVKFYELEAGEEYHFCIRHRNHLDILTAEPLLAGGTVTYDFTLGVNRALGTSQQKWDPVYGMAMMYAGDYNQDGVIQTTDYDAWESAPAINYTYSVTDGSLDGVVQATDYDIWVLNKAKVGIVEIAY